MEKIPSKIPFNYTTIKVTQGRLDKGLLAIPVSLVHFFPKRKGKIYVATGLSDRGTPKTFTPYTSSSRECRIGGMRDFYEKFHVKNGDEMVVQRLDLDSYRVMTEAQFEHLVKEAEKGFDKAKDESTAEVNLKAISEIANTKPEDTLFSEYYRLTTMQVQKRKRIATAPRAVREDTPASIRTLLAGIYHGRCQVTGFGFLMKSGKPYFEIHHIKPEFGNHVKNLLVVSPNVHAQFDHAFVEEYFDEDGWLRQVKLGDTLLPVKHAIDVVPKEFAKEIHSEI
jgi:hypothetical protein